MADDLFCPIPLDAFGARVPTDDLALGVEHEYRIVRDGLDEKPEATFALLQVCGARRELLDTLRDALLQRLVQALQLVLSPSSRLDLALARLVETRIVDGDRRLAGDARHDPFGAIGEDARVGMAEEKAAKHLAGARHDRNSQIAAHRQMAGRHAVIRRILPVARVAQNVVRTDRTPAAKGRLEHRRVAWHRKLGECLTRRA